MQSILTQAMSEDPREVVSHCPRSRPGHDQSPFDRSLLDFLVASFLLPKRLWNSLTTQEAIELPPLHPTAQLFQDQMLALPPFANMTRGKLSQSAVSVVIPSWLVGTEEACHVEKAAERTFGRLISLESPPSAAYTAAGYELCRTSYDAFECTGPGRIMMLEVNGKLAVASLVRTPLLRWSADPVTFACSRGLTAGSITA